MIEALRALEASKAPRAWLEVAALFPRVTETSKLAFVKALRRLKAVEQAVRALGASEEEALAALVVMRVMKPKLAPIQNALVHASTAVRREAAVAAAVVPGHPALRTALLVALDDPDHLVRDFSISALRRHGLDAEAKQRFQARLSVEDNDLVLMDLESALA